MYYDCLASQTPLHILPLPPMHHQIFVPLALLFTLLFTSTVNAQLTTNRDGALDKSFGQNGFAVATDRVGLPGEALLLPDGTVFQAHTGDSFASGYLITKRQPDGQLNVSFGQNGVKVIAFPHYNVVTSLAIQPDGKDRKSV